MDGQQWRPRAQSAANLRQQVGPLGAGQKVQDQQTGGPIEGAGRSAVHTAPPQGDPGQQRSQPITGRLKHGLGGVDPIEIDPGWLAARWASSIPPPAPTTSTRPSMGTVSLNTWSTIRWTISTPGTARAMRAA